MAVPPSGGAVRASPVPSNRPESIQLGGFGRSPPLPRWGHGRIGESARDGMKHGRVVAPEREETAPDMVNLRFMAPG